MVYRTPFRHHRRKGIFRVLTIKGESEDSLRPSNVADEGITTPAGRHFYCYFTEDIREATPDIGASLSVKINRTDAVKWDIATWLGLSSVPVGRATHWPHGGRTKLQPHEKTTKHYTHVALKTQPINPQPKTAGLRQAPPEGVKAC